jgi:type III pantothenate kinase
MLLAIDIGNTNITLGLWDGEQWHRHWRLRTVHDQTIDEYGVYLRTLMADAGPADLIDGAIIASVVPPLTATFAAVCRDYLGQAALQVRTGMNTGIRIATENPSEVGADRIVNAAAAFHLYPGYSIVVDIGTATTFDVVSGQGELLGVAIAPGLGLAAEALASRAAQLGRIALEAPPQAIGRNTIHAMQSGLIFGYVGLIEGLVRRIKGELEASCPPEQVQVIGTGGMITLIAPHTRVIDHIDPWLTLTGLRLIYERNHSQKPGGSP